MKRLHSVFQFCLSGSRSFKWNCVPAFVTGTEIQGSCLVSAFSSQNHPAINGKQGHNPSPMQTPAYFTVHGQPLFLSEPKKRRQWFLWSGASSQSVGSTAKWRSPNISCPMVKIVFRRCCGASQSHVTKLGRFNSARLQYSAAFRPAFRKRERFI